MLKKRGGGGGGVPFSGGGGLRDLWGLGERPNQMEIAGYQRRYLGIARMMLRGVEHWMGRGNPSYQNPTNSEYPKAMCGVTRRC